MTTDGKKMQLRALSIYSLNGLANLYFSAVLAERAVLDGHMKDEGVWRELVWAVGRYRFGRDWNIALEQFRGMWPDPVARGPKSA